MTEKTNTTSNNILLPELVDLTTQWHYDRNLIHGSDDKSQYLKLVSEAGELATSIAKKSCIKDDIGDLIVVLINLAERNGLTLESCLEHAYKEIKDRKGRMIDGTFVKESDLAVMAAEDSLK